MAVLDLDIVFLMPVPNKHSLLPCTGEVKRFQGALSGFTAYPQHTSPAEDVFSAVKLTMNEKDCYLRHVQ